MHGLHGRHLCSQRVVGEGKGHRHGYFLETDIGLVRMKCVGVSVVSPSVVEEAVIRHGHVIVTHVGWGNTWILTYSNRERLGRNAKVRSKRNRGAGDSAGH